MPSTYQIQFPNVQIKAPTINPAADLQKLINQLVKERQQAAAIAARAQSKAADREAKFQDWQRRELYKRELQKQKWNEEHTSTHSLYDPSTNETRTVDIIARNEKAAKEQADKYQQSLNDNYLAKIQEGRSKELANLESLDVGRQEKQLKSLLQAETNQIAQMSGASADIKKKLLEDTAAQFRPYSQQVAERKKAIQSESSLSILGKELGMGLGRLWDAARHPFASPQEQIAMAQARSASNKETIESSPYMLDQLRREQAGEGWWELGSGDTGSRLLNVGRTVANIAPELATTIGVGMLTGGAGAGLGALATGGRAAATAGRLASAANVGRVAGGSLGMGLVGATTAPGYLAEAITARNPQASQEQLEQMQEAGQGASRLAGGLSNALFLPSTAGAMGALRGLRQGIREGGVKGALSGAVSGVEKGVLAKAAATAGQSAVRRAVGAAPLSMTEGALLTGGFQLGQNWAYNRGAPAETQVPWHEGVPEAMLGGGILGGTLGSMRGFVNKRAAVEAKRASRERVEQALEEAPTPEQAAAPTAPVQKPSVSPEQLDFLIRDAEGTGIGSYDRLTALGMKPDDVAAAIETSPLPDAIKNELYDAHSLTKLVNEQRGEPAMQLGSALRPLMDRFKEIADSGAKVKEQLPELQAAIAEFKQSHPEIPDAVIDAVFSRSTLAGKNWTINKDTHPLFAAALSTAITTSKQALARSTLLNAYRKALRAEAEAYLGQSAGLQQSMENIVEQSNAGQQPTPTGQPASGQPGQPQQPATPMAGNVPATEGAASTASGAGAGEMATNPPTSADGIAPESLTQPPSSDTAANQGGAGGKPQPDNGKVAPLARDAQGQELVPERGTEGERSPEAATPGLPTESDGTGTTVDQGSGPAGDIVNAETPGGATVADSGPLRDNVTQLYNYISGGRDAAAPSAEDIAVFRQAAEGNPEATDTIRRLANDSMVDAIALVERLGDLEALRIAAHLKDNGAMAQAQMIAKAVSNSNAAALREMLSNWGMGAEEISTFIGTDTSASAPILPSAYDSLVRTVADLDNIGSIKEQLASLPDIPSLDDMAKRSYPQQKSGNVFVSSMNKSVNNQIRQGITTDPVMAVTKYLKGKGLATPADMADMALALAKAGKNKEAKLVADAYTAFAEAGERNITATEQASKDPINTVEC